MMSVNNNIRIGNNISLGKLLGIAFIVTLAINYIYAGGIYFAYVFLSFAIMIFTYVKFIKNIYRIHSTCRALVSITFCISLLNAIVYGDIKSNLLLNISLILPLVISTLNIKLVNVKKGLIWCSMLALVCVIAQVEFSVFGHINSNSFSFLAYMGISVGFIWLKCAKNKIVPILYLLISYFYILQTGSRNVAIVILLCFVLLLVPQRIWKNPWFYRSIYIFAILYTVFAIYVMKLGFANTGTARFLDDYVSRFADKAWEMERRVDFLLTIQYKLRQAGIIEQLFGSGIMEHHGHNLFFQSVFIYGYIGTFLVYIVYFIVFEMAYKIIKKDNNMVVLGCVIIMIGHFFIQGADVYMLGTETCSVMSAAIMGLIMQQYRSMREKTANTLGETNNAD